MKVAVIGASGYTGQELLRILANHPQALVTTVTSRQEKGQKLTALFPSLSGLAIYDELIFEDPENIDLKADVYFTAVPHGIAMESIPKLLNSGAKVIDLSADFRLRDLKVYEDWYQAHSCPDFINEAVYGLPELHRQEIKKARLIANPGCYPTGAILALAPLFKANFIKEGFPIIVDSKSGLTGAGRNLSLVNSFCEAFDSFKAYKVVGHRHTPEIEQELNLLSGTENIVSFTPHLLPINRGILTTAYLKPNNEHISWSDLNDIYQNFYQNEMFVRLRPQGFEPQTSEVRATNFCDISFYYDRRSGLIKVISVIDNICRGASGQAVANLNLAFGFKETLGLSNFALRP